MTLIMLPGRLPDLMETGSSTTWSMVLEAGQSSQIMSCQMFFCMPETWLMSSPRESKIKVMVAEDGVGVEVEEVLSLVASQVPGPALKVRSWFVPVIMSSTLAMVVLMSTITTKSVDLSIIAASALQPMVPRAQGKVLQWDFTSSYNHLRLATNTRLSCCLASSSR